MAKNQLRQLENNVEIIGTLKSKQIEVRESKSGNNYVSGKLVVLDRLHLVGQSN